MMELPFHTRISPEERRLILDLEPLLANDARSWLAPVRDSLPSRTFDNVSQIVAASAPWADAKALASCVRFCMWVYRFDHLFDAVPGITAADLEKLEATALAALNAKGGEEAPDFLAGALAELCADFARSPAAPVLLPEFKSCLVRDIEANRYLVGVNTAIRSRRPLPSIEEIIREAAYSVYHRSCTLSLLLAVGEPQSPLQLPGLRRALHSASLAVRLANDLRTHARDVLEGSFNLLSLGYSPAQVKDEIARNLKGLERELDRWIEDGAHPRTAEAVWRITNAGIDMYRITDILSDV